MTDWLIRDGMRLAVHTRGQGPDVVFQHGLCGDARQTFEAFPKGDRYRLTTLDCRGHGQSDADGPYRIATFADDVAALIAGLSGPVVLGGISMGGAIAIRLAVLCPDLMRALILVRPAWVAEPAPANMAPNVQVGALLASHDPATARAVFAASPTAVRLRGAAPDNLASLLGFFDRTPQTVTAALLQRISADGPGVTLAEIAAIRLPTLICAAPEDAIHPIAFADRLAGLIPGSRRVDLPPKGRDKPAHLAALGSAIDDFLKEL